MQMLNNLKSLVKKRKRIGRGGDRGGTSGRGHKGQKARSGPHIGVAFEGGQMPLTRRLPKHGFNNYSFEKKFEIINLGQINKFDEGSLINRDFLVQHGVIKGRKGYQLKVLSNGVLEKKLIIQADAFSKSAIEAITKLGGQANTNKEK